MKFLCFTHVIPVKLESGETYPENVYINPNYVIFVKSDPCNCNYTLIRAVSGAWTVNERIEDVVNKLRMADDKA